MKDPRISQLVIAYMAWPNDAVARDRWMAVNIAYFASRFASMHQNEAGPANCLSDRKEAPSRDDFEVFGGASAVAEVAWSSVIDDLEQVQNIWPRVAEILQTIVDIAYETREEILGGPSISKAIDVVELSPDTPGHSQLRRAWSNYRDVAHLITAAAYLAFEGRERLKERVASAVIAPVLLSPEAVLALAAGLEEFGLQTKPYRQETSLLPPDTLWRVPEYLSAESKFLPRRRLTSEQLNFLTNERRAPKK